MMQWNLSREEQGKEEEAQTVSRHQGLAFVLATAGHEWHSAIPDLPHDSMKVAQLLNPVAEDGDDSVVAAGGLLSLHDTKAALQAARSGNSRLGYVSTPTDSPMLSGMAPAYTLKLSPMTQPRSSGELALSWQSPVRAATARPLAFTPEHLKRDNLMTRSPPAAVSRRPSSNHKSRRISENRLLPGSERRHLASTDPTQGDFCTVTGCLRVGAYQSRCLVHKGIKLCSIEDCNRPVQSRGCCKSHGGGARCQHPDCGKGAISRGRCRSHGGGTRCSVTSCLKWAQRFGWCVRHAKAALAADPENGSS